MAEPATFQNGGWGFERSGKREEMRDANLSGPINKSHPFTPHQRQRAQFSQFFCDDWDRSVEYFGSFKAAGAAGASSPLSPDVLAGEKPGSLRSLGPLRSRRSWRAEDRHGGAMGYDSVGGEVGVGSPPGLALLLPHRRRRRRLLHPHRRHRPFPRRLIPAPRERSLIKPNKKDDNMPHQMLLKHLASSKLKGALHDVSLYLMSPPRQRTKFLIVHGSNTPTATNPERPHFSPFDSAFSPYSSPSPAKARTVSLATPLVHHPPIKKGDTHHLVSLTSSTYGSLLLIDPQNTRLNIQNLSEQKHLPPPQTPQKMAEPQTHVEDLNDAPSPDSVINTWELMDGLDDS
ncbi:hypothetical protein NL676_017016 [Syzygium grande]|nr:hypothetical protein NL676_017016 [Syzygium grande]